MAKLCVKAFGISFGIVAGGFSFMVGVLNILFYFGSGLNKTMAMLYLGYRPTLFNVIFYSVSWFIFAFCLGSTIAWLYNRIVDESSEEITERIKMVARSIWESKGKPDNSSIEDWEEAKRRVKGI
jgi:Protein of unknown function (DUF2934)